MVTDQSSIKAHLFVKLFPSFIAAHIIIILLDISRLFPHEKVFNVIFSTSTLHGQIKTTRH